MLVTTAIATYIPSWSYSLCIQAPVVVDGEQIATKKAYNSLSQARSWQMVMCAMPCIT